MKHYCSQHSTTLEAETLVEMLKLDKLEKVLVAYHEPPIMTVKDWSERPDRQQWGIHTITYTTEALKQVYETIGFYVHESDRITREY